MTKIWNFWSAAAYVKFTKKIDRVYWSAYDYLKNHCCFDPQRLIENNKYISKAQKEDIDKLRGMTND